MKKVLVAGQREWSVNNIKPALDTFNDKSVEFIYWDTVSDITCHPKECSLIITCEPHNTRWKNFYSSLENKSNVIAMQQGLFWSPYDKPSAEWFFDKYMVWGEQMVDCSLRNNLSRDRMIITGCPKHDAMFSMTVEDKGHVLFLNDFWDSVKHFNLQSSLKFTHEIITPHPATTQHKIQFDTLEYIRTARAVVCCETGCGVWAMIMKKPFMAFSHNHNRNDFDKSNVLNIKEFTTDYDDYVKWSVTGNGSIKRVQDVIKGYL